MKIPAIAIGIVISVTIEVGSAEATEKPQVRYVTVQSCDCMDQFNYGFGDGQRFGSGYGWGVGHGFGTGYGFGAGFGFNGGSAGGYSAGYRHRSQHFSEYHRIR